jgi:predicted RNase H-like HicB family nuclease
MKFRVTMYQDEDGMFIAEVPSVPGCVSQGKTREEARANVADAIRGCLEARRESGLPLVVETEEIEVMV